jgi:precorrin-6B methylase 2
MSSIRQTGIVVVLTALAGIGFVVWITTAAPADKAEPPKAEPQVTMADPAAPRDPNQPYEPQVGQAGKDVVWVPTSEALVQKMLDLGEVDKNDYVIDLGSGDGRTVIAAAKRGATAVGIEYNPDMVELSKKNAAAAKVTDRATFIQADLFKTDLSKATVITMFLLPRINMELRPRLLELAPGTRIVSNSFTMEDWEADRTETIESPECQSWCTALLWIVPAKVDGTWNLPDGPLVLTQTFQTVSGTLAGTALTSVELTGDQLTFSIGGQKYQGRVSGNSMTGSGGRGGSWTARRTPPPAAAPSGS